MLSSSDRKTFPRVSLQLVLILPFVLLVVLSAGLVGYLSYWNSQRAVHDVTRYLRDEITTRTGEYLQGYLETPHLINRINASALGEGWLDAGDQAALERYLWQQVQKFEPVTSIYFGNREGGLVNAGREGEQGPLYLIATEGFRAGLFEKHAVDSRGRRTGLLSTVPDFDARTRPWFTGAVEKREATWSEVYILFTGHDIAISASRPVYAPDQSFLGVVSVDIFLSHLSDFLGGQTIGKTGESFIMEPSGLLIATSAGEDMFTGAGDGTLRRLEAGESVSPLIRAAAAELSDRFGEYGQINTGHDLSFQLEGDPHYLIVSPLQDEYGLDWLTVMVIPEADFMAQVEANNRLAVGLIGLAMLTAILLGILTARWIATPVSHMSDTARAVSEGRWQQKATTAWITEIDELTASFNHMNQKTKQMIEDLTGEIKRRTQLEKELDTLIQELNTANANLKKFAEVSAHHLQEPARRMGSYARLLRAGLENMRDGEEAGSLDLEDITLPLQYIEEGARRLQQLLRDIQLYLAASEPRGEVKLLDTGEVVGGVIQGLEEKVKQAEARVEVGNLPPLYMDRQRLEDIFRILLNNALDFCDPRVTPRIYIRGETVDGRPRFQVEDNGPGIPARYQERVFGIFERLQPGHTGPAGTGIGLAVVRRIVESLKGRVWIEDASQGGALVIFELPGEAGQEKSNDTGG